MQWPKVKTYVMTTCEIVYVHEEKIEEWLYEIRDWMFDTYFEFTTMPMLDEGCDSCYYSITLRANMEIEQLEDIVKQIKEKLGDE